MSPIDSFDPWVLFKQALLKVEFQIYVSLHSFIWGQLKATISGFLYVLYTKIYTVCKQWVLSADKDITINDYFTWAKMGN